VELEDHKLKVQELVEARRRAKLANAGKELVEKAAAEKEAVTTDSGLVFVTLREGTGASPADTDSVRVHYRGGGAEDEGGRHGQAAIARK
jgi:FKBP-type peptidyl-prolyl cis-trans isomerase FkpA